LTCSPGAIVGEVDARAAQHVVVNEHGIVLGRIRSTDFADASVDATAEEVMQPGPATVRADTDLEQARDRLNKRRVPDLLVTTPEGELLGKVSATEQRTQN